MEPVRDLEFEAKVYEQAGEWVRLGNGITWSTGALFIPLALGALPLAIARNDDRNATAPGLTTLLLAVASIHLLWIYIAWLYRNTVMQARRVLIEIETARGIAPERSLYVIQQQPSVRGLSLTWVQYITGSVLVLVWVGYLLILLRQ